MPFTSRRAAQVPESVFARMDRALGLARTRGLDLIDLSIGSSDLAPPDAALEALRDATRDPGTYRYPLFSDTRSLREAAARSLARRYGPTLDPDTQVLPLIGAQEGLAHLLMAVTDPGDVVALPDPCYPPYLGAVAVAGLRTHLLPLTAERAWLPDLDLVPADVPVRALILNYPNNPTSAVATPEFFQRAVDWCRARGALLIHDHPYAELTYGEYVAPSVLCADGALECAVELHSLSKSHHMGGFRVGYAVGNAEALAALRRVKGAIDFHPYLGIQRMAALALDLPPESARAGARVFEARRDALLPALHEIGWEAQLPQASMYAWARPPGLTDSVAFAEALARETGVALAPGRAFGQQGEGHLRFALVQPPERLREAVRRAADFTMD